MTEKSLVTFNGKSLVTTCDCLDESQSLWCPSSAQLSHDKTLRNSLSAHLTVGNTPRAADLINTVQDLRLPQSCETQLRRLFFN